MYYPSCLGYFVKCLEHVHAMLGVIPLWSTNAALALKHRRILLSSIVWSLDSLRARFLTSDFALRP